MSVANNRHVITINIAGSIDVDTHHAWFIAESAESVKASLHGNKFGTEDQCFACRLLLRKPFNQSRVDVDKEASV